MSTTITPCGCTQVLEPDSGTDFSVCDNAGAPAFTERGVTALAQGVAVGTVTFLTRKASVNYSFIELAVENLIDTTSLSITAQVTSKTVSGFAFELSGLPDNTHYQLRWNVYVASLTVGL